MFQNLPLIYFFGPALLIVLILGAIIKAKAKPTSNVFDQSVFNLKITVFQVGILLALLWLSLPVTPALSTIWYPESIQSINSNEKILVYLQKYNQAIVRTTEVVYWSLFIITWFFLTSIYSVIKAHKYYKSH